MPTNRTTLLLTSAALAVLGWFALAASGWWDGQARALSALSQRGYSLSVEEFRRAAKDGDAGLIERFLAAGIAADVRSREGLTALGAAAAAGNKATTEALLAVGARGAADEALLAAAIASGKVEVLRLLLASPRGLGHEAGETLLTAAVEAKQREMLEALLPAAPTADKSPAFIAAVRLGDTGLADMLLSAGASLWEGDSAKGRTALMQAVKAEQAAMVEFLLRSGADRFATDHTGQSAAEQAVNQGSKGRLLSLLLAPVTAAEREHGVVLASVQATPPPEAEASSSMAGLPEVIPTTSPVLLAKNTATSEASRGLRRLRGEIITSHSAAVARASDLPKWMSLVAVRRAMLPCLLVDAEDDKGCTLDLLNGSPPVRVAKGEAVPGLPWSLQDYTASSARGALAYPSWWWPQARLQEAATGRSILLLKGLPARVGELVAVLRRDGSTERYEAAVGDTFATTTHAGELRHEFVIASIQTGQVIVQSRDEAAERLVLSWRAE